MKIEEILTQNILNRYCAPEYFEIEEWNNLTQEERENEIIERYDNDEYHDLSILDDLNILTAEEFYNVWNTTDFEMLEEVLNEYNSVGEEAYSKEYIIQRISELFQIEQ